MRLVSLCPSTTELIFDLGMGDALVGITRFCIHPAEGVAGIQKVGGTKNPDIGNIVALRPDLVLLNEEENRREDWQALHEQAIACHLSCPRNAAEATELVADLGRVLGAEAAASRICGSIEAARQAVAADKPATPVRFAYLIWRNPLMTVNGSTYISALLGEAGGVNVFAEREPRYPEISAEDLAAAAPDRVLLSSEPFPFKDKHLTELAEATALPRDRFALVDGEQLSWHGSRTAIGLRYALTLLS